jgi:hypothetical protein
MTRQPSCADVIGEHLASRIDEIRALEARLEAYADGEARRDWDQDPYEEAAAWPLSIDVSTTVDVCLSTGGPADGFRVTFSLVGTIPEPIRAEYWYQDWFDGATLPLDEATMESVVNLFGLESMVGVDR